MTEKLSDRLPNILLMDLPLAPMSVAGMVCEEIVALEAELARLQALVEKQRAAVEAGWILAALAGIAFVVIIGLSYFS